MTIEGVITSTPIPMRPDSLSLLSFQVSSPHLARSYHHLFPVPQFEEISAAAVAAAAAAAAVAATATTPGNGAVASGAGAGKQGKRGAAAVVARGATQGGRRAVAKASCAGCLRDLSRLASYRCPECGSSFCLDCDMYVHDSLHNCPGCC